MNEIKFKQAMLEHHDTQTSLADAMGLPQSAISQRVTGKVDFRQTEINFIIQRYELTADQVREIFFDHQVS